MGAISQGEAGRLTLLLALIGTLGGSLTGCQNSTPEVKPLRFVSLEALYPLHPLWHRAVQNAPKSQQPLWRESDATNQAPVRPPLLGAEPEIQETLAEDRQQHIVSKADFFRKQYVDSLAKTAIQQIDRETRLKQKELEARFQAEITKELTKREQEEERRRLLIRDQIHNRSLAEILYKAQLESYVGQEQQQARARLERVQSQLRTLTAERDSPRPDFRPTVLAKLASLRKELDTDLVKYQRDLSDTKMREIDKTLSKQGIDLKAELEAIPQLAQTLPSTNKSLTKPALQMQSSLAGSVNGAVVQQMHQEAKGLDANLLVQVRRDVERAVQQIAAQKGWQLVATQAPKSSDGTNEMRQALQHTWNLSKEQVIP